MPETDTRTDGAAAEAMQLWRNWLTETERQWNSFFSEVMGRDSFGRVAGTYMEAYSVVQRALNQGMERYLNTFNLPTHSDVVELGVRPVEIVQRVKGGMQYLLISAEQVQPDIQHCLARLGQSVHPSRRPRLGRVPE